MSRSFPGVLPLPRVPSGTLAVRTEDTLYTNIWCVDCYEMQRHHITHDDIDMPFDRGTFMTSADLLEEYGFEPLECEGCEISLG